MQESKHITIISSGRKIVLNTGTILYVLMTNKIVEIHVSGGKIYPTRMTLSELEKELGDGFIKVHRGCIVSAMAIHNIILTSTMENLLYIQYERKIRLLSSSIQSKRALSVISEKRGFLQQMRITVSITVVLRICPSHLLILKWFLMMKATQLTGFSDTEILHLQSLKKCLWSNF